MRRFGVADLREIKTRTYWAPKDVLPRTIERFVEEGRLIPVDLPRPGTSAARRGQRPTRSPEPPNLTRRLRTTLCRPSTRSSTTATRAAQLFGFEYKLEMYVPKEERQFGHFVLPVLYDNELVARLDSERDRKTNELVVRQLHWEAERPGAHVRRAVDAAIADLAAFVKAG